MMENKEIVKNYLNHVWGEGDLDVIDDYFTADTIIHSPFKKTKGAVAMRDIVQRWLEVFPDLTCHWDDYIAEGNKVVSRWHAVGTHMGDFFDTLPTHKEVCYSGIHTYELKDGKIIEYWALVDIHGIFTQLSKNE